jgi:hypothetical protein
MIISRPFVGRHQISMYRTSEIEIDIQAVDNFSIARNSNTMVIAYSLKEELFIK